MKKPNTEEPVYGFVMPSEQELEEIILGSILIDTRVIDTAMANLMPEDFYNNANKTIFQGITNLYTKGISVDIITLNEELKRMQEIENVGGVPYLMVLTDKVASTVHFESHVGYLVDVSLSRQILINANNTTKEVVGGAKTGKELIGEVINTMNNLMSRVSLKKAMSFKDKFIEILKKLTSGEQDMLGVSTGFMLLDKHTGGVAAPDLTIIAGQSGEGKSTLALNIAHRVALTEGQVLFFSCEMKEEQLIYKLISNECNTSVMDVRKGNIPSGIEQYIKSTEANLKIFDRGDFAIDEIVALAKYESSEVETKLIVVDYLQLVSPGIYAKKGQTRNDEVAIVSRKLKALAMALNVPVIALSQVNRDKRRRTYQLADLRDSGAIEQDADNVWFIFRPKVHDMDSYMLNGTEVSCEDNDCFVIIEKNRLGETGELRMKFLGEFSRFEDCEESVLYD